MPSRPPHGSTAELPKVANHEKIWSGTGRVREPPTWDATVRNQQNISSDFSTIALQQHDPPDLTLVRGREAHVHDVYAPFLTLRPSDPPLRIQASNKAAPPMLSEAGHQRDTVGSEDQIDVWYDLEQRDPVDELARSL